MIKGVAAVSIHGQKDQEERSEAMRDSVLAKDVLVATDIAAKGIDLPVSNMLLILICLMKLKTTFIE